MGITSRQQQTLDFIERSINERGYPPTLREIGEHMGIRSTNGVTDHLRALERKGFIRRTDFVSRGVQVVQRRIDRTSEPPAAEDVIRVPVVHRIVTGLPVLAAESIAEYIFVDAKIADGGGQEIFAFKVAGDAMFQMGILAGDKVIVRRKSHAERGAIVLALIGDEAIVRVFYPERDYVRFQAASPSAPPVLVRASDWRPVTMLIGQVVGLFRRFA